MHEESKEEKAGITVHFMSRHKEDEGGFCMYYNRLDISKEDLSILTSAGSIPQTKQDFLDLCERKNQHELEIARKNNDLKIKDQIIA